MLCPRFRAQQTLELFGRQLGAQRGRRINHRLRLACAFQRGAGKAFGTKQAQHLIRGLLRDAGAGLGKGDHRLRIGAPACILIRGDADICFGGGKTRGDIHARGGIGICPRPGSPIMQPAPGWG